MDIYTIVSILLILFVGFYDLIVNRLKKYKFSDENIDNALQTIREQSTNNKLKQKQKRRLIVFASLYVPLALIFQIILDLFFDTFRYGGLIDEEIFSADYFKSLFGINLREYDIQSLVGNYLIFSVLYFAIGLLGGGKNTPKILSSYITIKSLARLLFIIIMSFFSKPILHLLFNPLKVRKGTFDPLETADLKYHYEHFFEEGTIFYLYSFTLFFLINFIYNELVKKSSGNKKEDVLSKLSYLEELYKNKLIDKEEYESKLESLKKEASKSI